MLKKSTYINREGKELAFEYEDDPSFSQIMNIIRIVTNSVIGNDELGYAPYLLDYSIDYTLTRQLTDVELPSATDDCYKFLKDSGIPATIKNNNKELFNFIRGSAKDLIDYKKEEKLRESKFDELIVALIDLVENFGKQFENLNMDDVLNKWTNTTELLSKVSEKDIIQAIRESEKKSE